MYGVTVPTASGMSSARWLHLAMALLLLAVASRGVAADAPLPVDGEVLSSVGASMDASRSAEQDLSTESVLSMASCVSEKDAMRCLEKRANRYRAQLVGEQRAFRMRAMQPPEDQDATMKEAEDLFDTLLPVGKAADQDKDAATNSRGHKLKKKIHKLIKIIKIIVLIVVVKLKMVFVMFMLQTLFQAKLVAITFMILLIKKYYLWVEWKHKKEEKKAVVYYEHAQHQHHYDESDHFHDGLGGLLGHGGHHGHHDYHGKDVEPTAGAEPAGGWGGWWGKRSAEYPAAVVGANNPALAAQHLAYNAHAQPGLSG